MFFLQAPLPLYSAIHVTNDRTALEFGDWLEFSPLEVGMSKYGTFMSPEDQVQVLHFPEKFALKKSISSKFLQRPEQNLVLFALFWKKKIWRFYIWSISTHKEVSEAVLRLREHERPLTKLSKALLTFTIPSPIWPHEANENDSFFMAEQRKYFLTMCVRLLAKSKV